MAFSDAFKRPFQDFKSLVIGIVIMLIPIVNFIGIGYLLNCAKSAVRRDYKLPVWGNWLDLFINGIVALVIGIIYMIPAMIVFALTIGFTILSGNYSALMGGNVTTLIPMLATAGIGMLVTVVVGIIFWLLGSAAIVRYAEKGNFGAAFELRAIAKKAFTGAYFAAWLVGTIYALVLGAILSFIPFLGSAIASFICGVTMMTLIAEAYGKV
ncbi:MAG: DUF4013 domain-containing protein [Candidatus Aenigmatarchaeota archaeon]